MKTLNWLVMGGFLVVSGACTLSGSGPKAEDDDAADGAGAGNGSGGAGSGADNSSGTENASVNSSGAGAGSAESGLAVLGDLSHDVSAVLLEELGSSNDGLQTPSDVAFHPSNGELWVTNRAADSVTIFSNFGTPSQSSMTRHTSFCHG